MVTKFKDNIYNIIEVDNIAKSIIDTFEFQRLRYINQTGVMNLVYHTCNNTRFEHSIGTYHLAKLMIKKHTNNPDIILAVSIAGLIHDLGHVMFSHLFDDLFLKDKEIKNNHHENRSINIFNNIIKKYKINIPMKIIMVISDLVTSNISNYDNWTNDMKVGKWIFEIVSNDYSHIDVDKMDYIVRDSIALGLKINFNILSMIQNSKIINNHICYNINNMNDTYNLLLRRYNLYKLVYNNDVVKSIEIIIVKILNELDKTKKIKEWINNDKIIYLVDSLLWFNLDNKTIFNLYQKIVKREYPKIKKKIVNKKDFILKNKNNIINYTIGFCKKDKSNPLEKIPYYNNDIHVMNDIIYMKSTDYANNNIHEHMEYYTLVFSTTELQLL